MIPFVLEFVRFIVNLIVLTIVLYVAGFVVVGRKRARFLDAFVIALLGTVISTFFMVLLPHIPLLEFDGRKLTMGAGLGLILSFLGYLLLIRHYYETGWLGALAVAIVAVIVFVVFTIIMAALLVIPFLIFS
jgi:hypothetical protein